jgi:hypothetical protein
MHALPVESEARGPKLPLSAALVAASLLALAGCSKQEFRARLDAAPLEVGAPVVLAGVQVGRVKALSVKGDKAEVVFAVEGDNRLELHADACAAALSRGDKGLLVVQPGSSGAFEAGAALPQCQNPAATLAALAGQVANGVGEAVGNLLRTAANELGAGEAPCSALRVRVAGSEPVTPQPLVLPRGGLEVQLELENTGGTSMELAAAKEVGFEDASGRLAQVGRSPGESSWYLPVELVPHGKRAVTVILAAPAGVPQKLTIPVTWGHLRTCTAEVTVRQPR